MAELGAPPRRRDKVAVALLALLLAAGLVHYGRALQDEPSRTAPDDTPSSPAPRARAALDSAPPTDPATPASKRGGTCWDGRPTTALSLCGLPEGVRGLAWVYPSFGSSRSHCHVAAAKPDSYPVVESFECFETSMGQPVTITYDVIEDVDQVEDWLSHRVGLDHRRMVPGPAGGRCVFLDGHVRPARITGMYEKFPYVVSVYAVSPQAAAHAWRALVRQRAPQFVRGVRA